MLGLVSHCHERLTNTKGVRGNGREWKRIEEKWNEMLLPMRHFSSNRIFPSFLHCPMAT